MASRDDPRSLARDTPPPWHALSADETLERLGSSAQGIAASDAAARLLRDGPNRVGGAQIDAWWRVLVRQFTSLVILVLLASALLAAVMGRWIDAIAIFVAVAADITLGFIQESRAARDVAALRRMTARTCHVLRAGSLSTIPTEELVTGDLVVLESGDRVPADLRLIEAARVRVDQSLLTGESTPVDKAVAPSGADVPLAERSSFVAGGSLIVTGRATGAVVATGRHTQMGRIDTLVRQTDTPTPLQRTMRRFEGQLGIVVGAVAVSVLGIGLLVGLRPADAFLNAVSLAVAAIPEGLPIVLTVTLSLGVSRMARHRAVVRRLPAVEALGSTTVIASDKTGTLTENRMTVERLWTPAGVIDLTERHAPVDVAALLPLRIGALSNDATRDRDSGALIGDPVDTAIVRLAFATGAVDDESFTRAPAAHLPYEPEHRSSRTVASPSSPTEAPTLLVKGAPELLLELSTHLAGGSPLDRSAVLAAQRAFSAEGMRVIGVATRPMALGEDPHAAVAAPSGLEFAGLIAMTDPPRADAADAVRACHRAGITVVMVTGDHPETAAAIGRRIGLPGSEAPVTGAEMEWIDDAALVDRLRASRVAARVSPQDKLRIVTALEAAGEVVAVTGDGVNDAPALKAASLGVAMGRGGTDVARDAADIVLTDDAFGTIVDAVREGRVTFAAVQKAVLFLVSTGLAALVAVTASLFFDAALLFLPVQMIWFNLVSNGLQDVGLAFEPGEGDELDRPPRSPRSGLLTGRMWARIVITGVWMGAIVLAAFRVALATGTDIELARTIALTTFAFLNLFQTFNSRSFHASAFRQSWGTNRLLVVAAFGSVVVHALAVMTPPGQNILGLAPLDATQWLICAGLGATVLGLVEVDKAVLRRRTRRANGD